MMGVDDGGGAFSGDVAARVRAGVGEGIELRG
jgi:hypothetical protein